MINHQEHAVSLMFTLSWSYQSLQALQAICYTGGAFDLYGFSGTKAVSVDVPFMVL